MRHLRLIVGTALGAVLLVAPHAQAGSSASTGLAPGSTATTTVTTTRHYIANLGGSVAPRSLGYNLFDTGPSKGTIDALPAGVRALVWLGQKCPTRIDDTFRARVRRLSSDRKVFGYFLSDEPHIKACPNGPKVLATRTAFIRRVSGGRQQSFIVLNQSSADWDAGYRDYRSFRPAVTGVSVVGIDAYPCHYGTCDYSKIPYKVGLATQYISAGKLAPVYQAFGQEQTLGGDHYYSLPTAAQEQRILQTWAEALPHPAFDYTYGWAHQSSANPTLVDSATLQEVFRSWFTG